MTASFSCFSLSVQSEPIDEILELQQLKASSTGVGAVVSFLGLMRDHNEGDSVASMWLEHYPGMTEKSIEKIIQQAYIRWSDIHNVRVVHRVGTFLPNDPIVFVGVATAHRGSAFAACQFIMDFLKTRAPFWKKECLRNQTERWVEARTMDEDALKKWE